MKKPLAAPDRTLARLFWPICLETSCMMLSGIVDTLMLSSIGDLAVGAAGTANTYMTLLIMMFNVASVGMLAVMTQYIGAGQQSAAMQAKRCGLAFNLAIGMPLSLMMIFFSPDILRAIGVAPNIARPTEIYLQIVGGGCLTNALIPVFSGHLRAFGHTKQPFIAAATGNAVNLVLNAYFLYVRHDGISGVAWATVISRMVNLAMVAASSHCLGRNTESGQKVPYRVIFRQILQIGLPSACENIIYSISITVIVSLLSTMDPSGFHVTARSYALQFTCFSHCASSALGQANAIMVGWQIGAGDYDACTAGTRRASRLSAMAAIIVGSATALLSPLYMPMFTADADLLRTTFTLLVINILLEVGRAVNVCYGNALKTIGDARFPMMLGVVFMLLCASGGTWLLGSVMGIAPSVACFIGMCMDECLRALLMIARWRCGVWRRKVLIAHPCKKEVLSDG